MSIQNIKDIKDNIDYDREKIDLQNEELANLRSYRRWRNILLVGACSLIIILVVTLIYFIYVTTQSFIASPKLRLLFFKSPHFIFIPVTIISLSVTISVIVSALLKKIMLLHNNPEDNKSLNKESKNSDLPHKDINDTFQKAIDKSVLRFIIEWIDS